MDKTSLSKYGWIIITVILAATIIAGAPFIGDSVSENILMKIEANSDAYVVNLDANGGTIPFDYILVIPNKPYGYIPNPAHDTKTFVGWYTSPTGGELVTSQTVFVGSDEHTLYARWK